LKCDQSWDLHTGNTFFWTDFEIRGIHVEFRKRAPYLPGWTKGQLSKVVVVELLTFSGAKFPLCCSQQWSLSSHLQ
jgi:hypothetical protein